MKWLTGAKPPVVAAVLALLLAVSDALGLLPAPVSVGLHEVLDKLSGSFLSSPAQISSSAP